MEKEIKKVKLSTLIAIVTILLLIIVGIVVYFTMEKTSIKDKENTVNDLQQNTTHKEVTNNNLGLDTIESGQKNSQENITNQASNELNQKYDLQLNKGTIELNGKEHTYEVRISSNIKTFDGYITLGEGIILFDGKIIKNKPDLYVTPEKKMIGKVTADIINKGDKDEYAVISIDEREMWEQKNRAELYIINANAELIQTLDLNYGTSITIEGKACTYEINENNIIWYSHNPSRGIPEKKDIEVVKYKMIISEDRPYIMVLNTYKESEVGLAGKV